MKIFYSIELENGQAVRLFKDGQIVGDFKTFKIDMPIRELDPVNGFQRVEHTGNFSFHFEK